MTARRRFASRLIGASLALLVAAPHGARADLNEAEKKAAAQTLFDEARQLTQGGDFASACPKFDESHRLDPTMGTKFYLADCLEHVGKLASAWSYYVEVVDAARAAGQKDREMYARGRAEALKPKLPSLVIEVPPEARRLAELAVTRDGIVLGEAQWGTAIPVDPGEHTVSVAAKGKRTWETRINAQEGQVITVDVPLLADAKAASSKPPPPPPPPPGSRGTGQRVAAIAVGAAGAVGVGVGVFFGLKAMDKHSESNEGGHCDPKDACDDAGLALRSDAIGAATISTVGFIAGGVALAGGAVLFLTAPSSEPAKEARTTPGGVSLTAVSVGAGRVSLLGRF